MVGRSQIGAVNEDTDGSMVSKQTVSELVSSLKSAFRKASFTRVEEELVSREKRMKKEIEEKNKENKLLQEKLHMEVLEKLKLQKECAELRELSSRLREDRDGLLRKLEEYGNEKKQIFDLTKKNCELECAKLNAEAKVEVCEGMFKVFEEKVSCLEKDLEMLHRLEKTGDTVIMGMGKDAVVSLALETNAGKQKVIQEVESRVETGKFDSDEKVLSETNPNPSGSSSHRKRPDNWLPLSEEIVEIIDSDDESASRENSGGIVNEGNLDKAHLGKNVAGDELAVQKRTLASSVDAYDNCPIENGKRVNLGKNVAEDEPAVQKRTLASSVDADDNCPIENGKRVNLGKNVAKDEPAVQKRTLASSVDADDKCPIENTKRVKIQEHATFTSPIEHHSPAALNLETLHFGKVDTSSKLSKLLSELGDDSSSSSGSDDELDLSLDYSTIFRTDDSFYKTLD